MELKFTEKQISQVLEKYYKEQLDVEGKVNLRAYAAQVGFEMYPTTETLIEMTIEGTMNIEDMKVPVKQQIPQTELENAFKYFLGTRNIEIESIAFDKGVSTHCSGYYKSEKTYEKPYFRGVIVKTKNITKKIGGK